MFFPDFSILLLINKMKNKQKQIRFKDWSFHRWLGKQRKEKKKQIIISHSFIVEPELSHSSPTRTTLSVLRPKQHDPQDNPQQSPNSMTHKTHPTHHQFDPKSPNWLTTLTDPTASTERELLFLDSPGNPKTQWLQTQKHSCSSKPRNSKNPRDPKTRFLQDSDSPGKPKTRRLQTDPPPKP